MDYCQHVYEKILWQHQRTKMRKRQITKLSNTCLRNVRDSLNWHANQISIVQTADQHRRALGKLAPRLFAEQDNRGSLHQPLQPPHCNGKSGGVHSTLGEVKWVPQERAQQRSDCVELGDCEEEPTDVFSVLHGGQSVFSGHGLMARLLSK